jgi:hypothetical protein
MNAKTNPENTMKHINRMETITVGTIQHPQELLNGNVSICVELPPPFDRKMPIRIGIIMPATAIQVVMMNCQNGSCRKLIIALTIKSLFSATPLRLSLL